MHYVTFSGMLFLSCTLVLLLLLRLRQPASTVRRLKCAALLGVVEKGKKCCEPWYAEEYIELIFTSASNESRVGAMATGSPSWHSVLQWCRGRTTFVSRLSPVYRVWQKPSCKAQWKGEEDKAVGEWEDNIRKWTACSSPSRRGQWRAEKWRKLVVKLSVVPQRPPAVMG